MEIVTVREIDKKWRYQGIRLNVRSLNLNRKWLVDVIY